ncbi:transporter [Halomicrobium sp. LC1Hm]|uniref:transporter n=1 Tax=Halomicrobium sp. LC1Hm TaxID=2610902 RepID=UPI0012983DE6|nr:transporter [Halomicrobium sp. LC1Hm]QGA82781.1 putative membrane protein [Halomicrobium sp. LC1Hm]
MSELLAGIYAVHMTFAALWTGSVVFVAIAVLPTAMDGEGSPAPLSAMIGKLKLVSRTSALLLFLTGGHLAATQYGASGLTGTFRGYLVIAMLVLWFVLAGLVEVGSSKLTDGFDQQKLREPARNARPFFLGATVVAVLLLLDAGIILGI